MTTPVEILNSIGEFRRDYPDPMRVAFLIMRFRDDAQYRNIVTYVKTAFHEFGITVLRADDKEYHTDLFSNIVTYMHGCGMGIAIFDRITTNEFNPNVSLEVGYMMALAKPVCFLVDENLTALHTDLLGRLYKRFNAFDPASSVMTQVAQWLRDRRLDFRCYQCSVLVNYNIVRYGFDQTFLNELIDGIKLMSPRVAVRLLKVRQSDDLENTVIDFEANRDFYEHLRNLHETNQLDVICGCRILDVSPIGDERPVVSFITDGEGHEAFQCCHLQQLEGFEHLAQEAIELLSENTSDINNCEIFVTYQDGYYYYHSNLVKQGFVHTTKVHTKDNNLFNALKMISGYFGNNLSDRPTEEKLVIAHHFKVKYILDERAITRNNLQLNCCGTSRTYLATR